MRYHRRHPNSYTAISSANSSVESIRLFIVIISRLRRFLRQITPSKRPHSTYGCEFFPLLAYSSSTTQSVSKPLFGRTTTRGCRLWPHKTPNNPTFRNTIAHRRLLSLESGSPNKARKHISSNKNRSTFPPSAVQWYHRQQRRKAHPGRCIFLFAKQETFPPFCHTCFVSSQFWDETTHERDPLRTPSFQGTFRPASHAAQLPFEAQQATNPIGTVSIWCRTSSSRSRRWRRTCWRAPAPSAAGGC